MTVKFELKSGKIIVVPGIKYYSSFLQDCGHGSDDVLIPGGLWIRESEIRAHIKDNEHKIDDIFKSAEATVKIYDDDTNEEPWRNTGPFNNTIVFRCHDDKFWEQD